MQKKAWRTLSTARRYGTVLLVTNAEEGWIELSCQAFLPSLLPLVMDLQFLSARTTYEQRGVDSPFEWKFLAFESEVGELIDKDHHLRKNVISFGDSAQEREALIRITECRPNCCTKSVKFVERPEISQLQCEHDLIYKCFKQLVDHDGNLDLCIHCA